MPSLNSEQPREREHDRNETWRSAPPNNTIMVSNLPLHFTENEVLRFINYSAALVDVFLK